MKSKLLVILIFCLSLSAEAQSTKRGPASTIAPSNSGTEDPEFATGPIAEPTAQPVEDLPSNNKRKLAPARVSLSDPFLPGWKSRDFVRAFGFSAGLVGSGNAIVIENTPDGESSWGFHFGFSKLADTYAESNTTSVTGTTTKTTTTSLAHSGAKRAATISFGSTYMNRIFRNDFILVRWGGFGGIDYITNSKSPVGSRTTSESSATPGTISITETGLGEQSIKSSMGMKIGPVFDAFMHLRWFPNISVGFIGGMLYEMDRKVTTSTSTVSRSYQSVGGVDQADTSNTQTNVDSVQNLGPAMSTYSLGGQNFSLFGNFVIRYLW